MIKKTMQYGIMSEFYACLSRLSPLTGREGMAIAKTRRSMRPHVELFEEMRRAVFEKYGKEDGQGRISVMPDSDNYDAFNNDMMLLIQEECEIEIFQIPEKDFDLDRIYCEGAAGRDYEIFELMMVEHNGESEGKPVEEKSVLDKQA